MKISNNPRLQSKLKALYDEMVEFNLSEDESDVKLWHINQAVKSIQRCLKRMDSCVTPKHAVRNIARTVISLNVINGLAKQDLIFTSEREDIAEILNEAAAFKGLNPHNEDITEDFRTW